MEPCLIWVLLDGMLYYFTFHVNLYETPRADRETELCSKSSITSKSMFNSNRVNS